MCGLVGFISDSHNHEYDKELFMQQALIIDTLRGEDSTGIFTVLRSPKDPAKSVSWYKAVVDGYSFVNTKDYDEFLGYNEVGYLRAAVGHNRAATVGGVSQDTAHPFQEGPITLVHNGTLHGTSTLPKTQFQVKAHNDSHTICHNLALVEPDEAHTVIERIDGAYALIWHDQRNDSINMVRNDQRPLALAYSKQTKTTYWASEAHMLRWLDMRINLGLGRIYSLKIDRMLTWLKDTPVDNPLVKEIQPSYSDWYSKWWNSYGTGGTKTKKSKRKGKSGSSQTGGYTTKVKPLPKAKAPQISGRLQEALLDNFGLMQEECVNFIPYAKVPYKSGDRWGTTRWNVFGKLHCPANQQAHGRDAIVQSVYDSTVSNRPEVMKHVWSVEPITFSKTDTDDYMIVCEFVRASTIHGDIRVSSDCEKINLGTHLSNQVRVAPLDKAWNKMVDEFKEMCKQHESLDYTDENNPTVTGQEDDPLDLFKGPGDSFITAEEWERLTEHGCIMCGRNLDPTEDHQILWVNDGHKDPMCLACQIDSGRAGTA